jgi:hypothetical protein
MTSRAWDEVRAFALAMPGAIEDTPWGERVIKIDHPPRRRANGLAYGPMLPHADLDLVRDWIDESYRTVAPRKFLAELDQATRTTTTTYL